jgi:succinate dehydrogenase / fumarate reductase flavoprotein subunit
MQGLADGYFVAPYTVGNYLADMPVTKVETSHPEFKKAETSLKEQMKKLISIKGNKTVDQYHKELGKIMWDKCGMSRSSEGLQTAKKQIRELRADFWKNVKIVGTDEELNITLEKAYRVADFLELGELMVDDAFNRAESCGGHFREESQTPDGEAQRNDSEYAYVAAWEYVSEGEAKLNKEELVFENVKLTQRSYK